MEFILTDTAFRFRQGSIPLLISIPHLGTDIPVDVRDQLTDVAHQVADTDWHLDRLYGFAQRLGASVLGARYSRYVIDLNRPSTGESLYPGQTTTGLCPTETFRGEPLYRDSGGPGADEISRRLDTYWHPYHAKLREELDRLKAKFGTVLIWEAHSIASVLPRLFDGKLPDLNVGTNSRQSCDTRIVDAIEAVLKQQRTYTSVIDGRFKGGHITRAYGNPEAGIHAVQLEMCQSVYMNESSPFDYRPELAAQASSVVERMISAALDAARSIRT